MLFLVQLNHNIKNNLHIPFQKYYSSFKGENRKLEESEILNGSFHFFGSRIRYSRAKFSTLKYLRIPSTHSLMAREWLLRMIMPIAYVSTVALKK